jgi:hypothetical protein
MLADLLSPCRNHIYIYIYIYIYIHTQLMQNVDGDMVQNIAIKGAAIIIHCLKTWPSSSILQ